MFAVEYTSTDGEGSTLKTFDNQIEALNHFHKILEEANPGRYRLLSAQWFTEKIAEVKAV